VRGDLKIRGYTVGQFPNAPLIVALVALLVGALAGGEASRAARAVFFVAFTIWGWEEATRGVNGLRRILGSGALVLVLVVITVELSGSAD
jgi:hypothetical protein